MAGGKFLLGHLSGMTIGLCLLSTTKFNVLSMLAIFVAPFVPCNFSAGLHARVEEQMLTPSLWKSGGNFF